MSRPSTGSPTSRPTSRQILRVTTIVVAGQNLDRDAVLPQRGDGRTGGLLGRIEEGEEALHDKLVLVAHGVWSLVAPGGNVRVATAMTRKPSSL